MKVLQLTSSFGFFGAEKMVLELSRALKDSGTDVVIGVFENTTNPHTELAALAASEGITTTVFRCSGKLDLGTIRGIRRFSKENGVDVIHTHGYKTNVYGFAAANFLRVPIVSTCHNWISGDLRTRTYYRIDKFILRRFDHVVAVSGAIEDELVRIGVDKGRISLVPNGIDVDRLSGAGGRIRDEFGIGAGTRVVGTVARLTPEKGLANLIAAASQLDAELPDAVFMIVGDGPLRDELETLARAAGLQDRFIFAGKRTDMADIYSALDIFVLPSLTEGLPMVLLEAMAAGKAVVASAVGAIPTVMENGMDGLLVEPGDVDGLASALTALLNNDERAAALGARARAKVERKYSSAKMSDKYSEIYRAAVERRSPRVATS